MWTLNIKSDNGVYLCFRCGKYGNWSNFVKQVIGFYGGEEQKYKILDKKEY